MRPLTVPVGTCSLLEGGTGGPPDMVKAADVVKTTIQLPRDLWKRVHVRAMDDGLQMNELVIAALRAYLGARR
jgi:hypothetical protein